MNRTAAITAVGGYVPEYVLTNFELEKMVDTNNEWILERTGIHERRILKGDRATSDMAVEAIKDLLKKTNYQPTDIDLIICATVSGDHVHPATANIIADKLGASNAWGYDITAACSSFLYALWTASKMVEAGAYKRVIVVGADKMSARINYEDRNTCIIFGDGAGAVLLEPNYEGLGIIDGEMRSDGSGLAYLNQKAGGSKYPATVENVLAKEHYAYQDGRTVFKFAVKGMADITEFVMKKNQLVADDIRYLVPHQANKRIIDATANRAGLPPEKVMINIQKYGNTTSGTIPLCLWDYQNELKKGDNLLLSAFGGGFTWGCIYLKWAY
ncbi:MAG: beta-ketoacyl-ACP synthase III [Bacteroidia bacterium]